jgi:hypothetical protein
VRHLRASRQGFRGPPAATRASGTVRSPCLRICSLHVFAASLYETALSMDIRFLMQSVVFAINCCRAVGGGCTEPPSACAPANAAEAMASILNVLPPLMARVLYVSVVLQVSVHLLGHGRARMSGRYRTQYGGSPPK